MVTAWSLAQAGRPAQARRFLNQAESEGSSGVMLKHAKGLLRLDSGDVRGAIASLQQAVEESGDTPSARLRLDLAKALAAAGNRAQARRLVDDLRSEELGEADRAAVSNLDVGLR